MKKHFVQREGVLAKVEDIRPFRKGYEILKGELAKAKKKESKYGEGKKKAPVTMMRSGKPVVQQRTVGTTSKPAGVKFREFNNNDGMTYGGAEDLPGGKPPLITTITVKDWPVNKDPGFADFEGQCDVIIDGNGMAVQGADGALQMDIDPAEALKTIAPKITKNMSFRDLIKLGFKPYNFEGGDNYPKDFGGEDDLEKARKKGAKDKKKRKERPRSSGPVKVEKLPGRRKKIEHFKPKAGRYKIHYTGKPMRIYVEDKKSGEKLRYPLSRIQEIKQWPLTPSQKEEADRMYRYFQYEMNKSRKMKAPTIK